MRKIIFAILLMLIMPFTLGATNYYLDNYGSDENDGLTIGAAWATLGYADNTMHIAAGDTLFIMGGTYTTDQHFYAVGDIYGGSEGSPLVFKAYGDSVAIFQNTGEVDPDYQRYWMFLGGVDYVVIDGWSYINPTDSLFIKLEGREPANYILVFTGQVGDIAEHNVIRGIEIDGNFPEGQDYSVGGPMQYCIGLDYADMDTIQSCYIHHTGHPTGDIEPGDGTNTEQGEGECIFARSINRTYIADNTFENSNHAIISIENYTASYPNSMYNKIINNRIINEWGGGIYLQDNSNYNLVEGNIFEHIGETTTYQKAGLIIDSSHNTIRRNVIYSPENEGFVMESMRFGTKCKIADSNLVYNNTVFGTEAKGLSLILKGEGANACEAASIWGNNFANNIFYKSYGDCEAWCAYESEMLLFLHDAHANDNWLDPDTTTTSPASTHFGYNVFNNNCIRNDGHDGDFDSLVMHMRDNDYAIYGNEDEYEEFTPFSLDDLETLDATAWNNNITDDPTLASEDPDAYGDNWWYLQSGSPCIDAGVAIDDTIGTYVETLYEGYGWDTLAYNGAVPDIGAYESSEAEAAASSAGGGMLNIMFRSLIRAR